MLSIIQEHPVASAGAAILIVCAIWALASGSGRDKKTKPDSPKPAQPAQNPGRSVPKQPGQEVRQMAEKLARLELELVWLSSLESASKFFYSLLEPLQALMGCARALRTTGLSADQRDLCLEYNALRPLAGAARKLRQLPSVPPAPTAPTAQDVARYEGLTPAELQCRIQEAERRVRIGRECQRDWELVRELERLGLFRLAEGKPEEEAIVAMGENAALLLKKQGIFPLYRDDGELANLPALRQSFNQGSEADTARPGLFLRRNGTYELFAAYNGIWIQETERAAK